MTRRGRHGLIFLNGELEDPERAFRLAVSARAVICADGGARHAKRLGLHPHFVAGDMDSLPRPLPRWKRTTFICDFDEDRSDFEKALDLACDLGLREVLVVAARGGGLDHELVNLALIAQGRKGLSISIEGRGRARLLGPGVHRLDVKKGGRFSLLAAPPAAVASLSGAKYPLKNHRLVPGSRGLGNRSLGAPVLRVRSGKVWFFCD